MRVALFLFVFCRKIVHVKSMKLTYLFAVLTFLSTSLVFADETRITIGNLEGHPGVYTAKCTTVIPSTNPYKEDIKKDCFIESYQIFDMTGKKVAEAYNIRDTVVHMNLTEEEYGIYIVQYIYFNENLEDKLDKVTYKLTHAQIR